MNKKVKFITLGCKVNQYETNAMSQKFLENGYDLIEENSEEIPDICIINTCTVTNVADRKSRQMLRKMKEKNKNIMIVACGCYAQVAKDDLLKMPEIDLIIGNNEKVDIVKYVEGYLNEKDYIGRNTDTIKRNNNDFNKNAIEKSNTADIENKSKEVDVEDVMKSRKFSDFGDVTFTEKTRAVVKIQDGCDRFCSYCIIPYARGRVRSRKPESIIKEITEISKKGIKEVVITGIHIASYGKDFKEDYKLIDLLEKINKIDGIERIRLGSLEPLLITDEFVNRLEKLDKICHHFHLSLQSGCDETLKRMNRRYTVSQFRNIVKILRNAYDDVNLTTDIIVGFPGETDEEFKQTYQFLKEIKFYKMHIFKYSQRNGTKAAIMENQIPGDIKEKRSKKLIELSDLNELEYNEKYIGTNIQVLFEEKKGDFFIGHTQNYVFVYCKNNENLENKIIKVRCNEAFNDHITGDVTKL